MASITRESKNGKTQYRLEYRDKNNRRKKIRLGGINRKSAEAIAAKVQTIVSSQIAGDSLPADTARWLSEIGDDLHGKLSRHGLCHPRDESTVGQFTTKFIRQHQSKVGDYGIASLERTKKLLSEHFGPDKPLRAITPEEAQQFRDWLVDERGYAQATVAGHIKRAKQFCGAAVKTNAIPSSPFSDVLAGTQANDSRSYYVPCEVVEKAISMAPRRCSGG